MAMGLTTRGATGLGGLLLALLMALLVAGPSIAAQPEDKRRAVELFEQSEELYRAGEMERAEALLNEAYELDPNPVLQYNLGRLYEALGKLEQAAKAYRLFLEGTPDAPDRGALERRIATLEKQIAEREALQRQREEAQHQEPAPPPPQPTPPPPDSGPGVAPWIVSGVGAALIVGAGVTGLLARRAHDDAVEDASFQGAKDSQDRAETLATVANIGFVVGGTALAVGVGWGVLGAQSSGTETPASALHPFRFQLGGSF